MQLLRSRSAPCSEFVSLSVLLKGDTDGDGISCRPGELAVIPSLTATMSQSQCVESMRELGLYVNSVQRASRQAQLSSKDQDTASAFAARILSEDELLLDEVQVFRPLASNGLALHYKLIREKSAISKFLPIAYQSLSSTPDTGKCGKAIEQEASGIILCVGVTGPPSSVYMTSLGHSISKRMKDCIGLLTKTGTADLNSSQTLLSALLLVDDEQQVTNQMEDNVHRILLTDWDESNADKKAGKSPMNVLIKRSRSQGGELDAGASATINSADLARITIERLAVLSVAEHDTIFRKYEGRASTNDKSGKIRRRKTGRDADLDNFEFNGITRSIKTENPSVSAESKSIRSKAAAKITKMLQLQAAKNDTSSRIPSRGKQHSVPALMASSRDGGGRNRRTSSDSTQNSRAARLQGRRSTSQIPTPSSLMNGNDNASTWSFDTNTDAFSNAQFPGFHSDMESYVSGRTTPNSIGSRSRSNFSRNSNFDPFMNDRGPGYAVSLGETTMTTSVTESTASTRPIRGMFDDEHELGQINEIRTSEGQMNGIAHNGDFISPGTRSLQGHTNGSDHSQNPRIQINVALNEDLMCFYKLSKMSSCSVEGVIQVQIKSSAQKGFPFFLMLRDPSGHIQSLQENKKFAENLSELLEEEPANTRPDYKYSVSIPKTDSYFPVMRYKCSTELRPVPIRVQTRVRLEDGFWRVALQISSNPHNDDNLTDLTIIMGVPELVKGESLTTAPPGGVWNASKRSVIWCVSELGGGEKFQLQARFEIEPGVVVEPNDEKPKFPVLVRCQCMYAQLSDVEVEVCDIPEVFPAEIKMKLARRFRLSHRERP